MSELKLGYNSMLINEAIQQVADNSFLLPAIQRDIAWTDLEQISDFFDSIYKGYPVNPILLLKMVKGKNDKLTTVYQFNLDTEENKLFNNRYFDFGAMSDGTEKYLVLDGQQRLTALYRGLRKSVNNKKLHFNALHGFVDEDITDDEENNLKREFFDRSAFLFKNDSVCNVFDKDFWICISDLYNCKDENEIDSLIENTIIKTCTFYEDEYNSHRKTQKAKERNKKFKEWVDFVRDKKEGILEEIKSVRSIFVDSTDEKGKIEYNLISFDELSIEEQRKRLLSIFIRFNMGGESLNPADLLYSQLAATTKIKDIKSLFRNTMDDINSQKEKSYFKLPHFMRLLWLVYGTSSFKTFFTSQDVQKCSESDIEDIKDALIKAKIAYLNAKFDFKSRVPYNMFLPVAYYFYQTKNTTFSEEDQKNIQVELAKYYSIVLLTGYLSGQSDSTLNRLKKCMTINSNNSAFENNVFDFKKLQKSVNEATSLKGRKLGISETEIDVFLDYEYGKNNNEIVQLFTFLAKENSEQYDLFPKVEDIDHMHPKKYALDKQQKQNDYPNLPQEVYNYFCETYNRLPNLQLLTAVINRGSKNDKPLKTWVEDQFDDARAEEYMKKQYISTTDDKKNLAWLEFENYKKFYNLRKQIIKNKLCEMFDVGL